MQKPFELIINRTKNQMMYDYGYGVNKVNITECIKSTHEFYGINVTENDFAVMLNKLTIGGKSSVLYYKLFYDKENQIISNLCVLFPQYFTNKCVDNIIKCIPPVNHMACINDITDTGYKFTQSQIDALNEMGYIMMDYMETMSYDDFTKLFNNKVFLNEYMQNLGQINGSNNILNKFNAIINKFNINVDNEFLHILLANANYTKPINISKIIDIHYIVTKLGIKLTKSNLINTMNYVELNEYTYNDQLKSLKSYYDCEIERRDVMDNVIMKTNSYLDFLKFINPIISSYNPIVDIIQILLTNDGINRIQYLLNYGYLQCDDTLLTLISVIGNNHDLLKKCMNNNIYFTSQNIKNIYTFCENKSVIDLMNMHKILPTDEMILNCTSGEIIKYIIESSLFVSTNTKNYYNEIEIDKIELSGDIQISDEVFLKIYHSLSENDKQKIVRLEIHDIFSLEKIYIYNIEITRIYLLYLMIRNWKNIVRLLCISRRYQYIIKYIDIEMILNIPNIVGRLWFYNNFIEGQKYTLDTSFDIFDEIDNTKSDIESLLSKPPLHDVTEMDKLVCENKCNIAQKIYEKINDSKNNNDNECNDESDDDEISNY